MPQLLVQHKKFEEMVRTGRGGICPGPQRSKAGIGSIQNRSFLQGQALKLCHLGWLEVEGV